MIIRLKVARVSPTVYPSPLVPVVPLRGRVPEAIDQALSELARDPDATQPTCRNALFAAYWPILQRACRRVWWRQSQRSFVQLGDLENEAFVIFAELLDNWSGTGSFTSYLLARFTWRLKDRARALSGPPTFAGDEMAFGEAAEHSHAAESALAILNEIVAGLPPFDQQLALARVRDGMSASQASRALGVSRRTVEYRWRILQDELIRRLARLTTGIE